MYALDKELKNNNPALRVIVRGIKFNPSTFITVTETKIKTINDLEMIATALKYGDVRERQRRAVSAPRVLQ